MFATTVVGEKKKSAVGVLAGGRITPVGTRRISACSGFAVAKLVDVGVATIATQLPGSPEQVPNTPLDGGAVKTTVAVPAVLVTTDRADSVPKSCATPLTAVSTRTGSPATGFPSGPIAVILTDDCEPPSWLMLSGMALTLRLNARPEGPVSGGASVFLTVHPAVAKSTPAMPPIIARRVNVNAMALWESLEVAEVDLRPSHDTDGIAGTIQTVEGHGRNRRDGVRARAEGRERRLLLGHGPHQRHGERRPAASGRNCDGHRAVEGVWDI